jgi:hypothetical protein
MNVRISYERALAYDYYYGKPFGNEMEGRSSVISADVAQAVDSAVPAIVEVFVSGDEAVEFTPRNEEDVEAAEQATVGANYVFFTQNNGYALAQDFIKDGLLQKTGVFKWKWDTSIVLSEKKYEGLDDLTLQILQSNPGVELVAHDAVPDPNGQPGPDGQPPMLHNVVVRVKKESGKVKVIVPAPEEVKISPDSMTLEVMDMPFIAHTPMLTGSDLAEMGISKDVIATLPKGDREVTDLEKMARDNRNDSVPGLDTHADEYRYNECYIRLDEDGDGIAELRKVCMVGDVILHDEVTDHIPMAIWTPKVMPHEVVGISLADDVMDLQLLKSTIWRGIQDSMYQSIAPRMFAQGDVNLDDALTIKPGGIIRGGPGSALTPIVVPFVGQQAFPMLEYADQEKDARVGFSALGPGMDPSSINKTATFVREMTNQTNARAKIIARNAAEFGFKPLFRGIMYLLAKHQQKALMVRLNNKFTPIDPETWNKEYDMTCNVGLGVGNKEQQLMHLQALGQDLMAISQSPFASVLMTPEKVFNYFEKKANLAGFQDATIFIQRPVDQQGQPLPPPPPPKPESVQVAEIKAQTDSQAAQMKQQGDMQMAQAKLQADQQREAAQAQADMTVARDDAAMKMSLEQFKIQKQAELERFKAELQAQVELQKAELQAHVSVQVARERPEPRPGP